MSENRKSVNGIQYLRAYAAILVVLNHFCNNIYFLSEKLMLDKIGGFGVDIFFIISGFIMAYTLSDFNNTSNKSAAISFIKRRILRIYPIYLIILVPIVLMYFLKVYLKVTDFSLYSLIGSILLIPDFTSNPHYHMLLQPAWTLVYEMFFYLTLSLTILFSKNKASSIINYSVILFVAIALVHLFNLQGNRLGWVNMHYMIGDPIFLDFILGFVLYSIHKSSLSINIPTWTMLPLLATLTVIAMYLASLGLPRIICFGLTSFVIVSIFTLNEPMKKSKNKKLLFLGAASYAIYLTHPLLFPFHIMLNNHFPWMFKYGFLDFLFAIVAILIGCLTHNKIEIKIDNYIKTKQHKS
ncbi:TPA: acyltransferase family protein [Klebsiella pneumoniae]